MSTLTTPRPAAGGPGGKTYEYDVFISYNHGEAGAWVLGELVPRLQRADVRVCVDEYQMPLGSVFLQWMHESIPRCRRVLAVISPACLESDWCGVERSLIEFRDPQGKSGDFVPLIFKACPTLPDALAMRKYIDLTRLDLDQVLPRLVQHLKGLGPELGLVPPPPHVPPPPKPTVDPATTRDARQGLDALADLLPTLEARDAASDFHRAAQAVAEQITPVSELKHLHDLYQKLEDQVKILRSQPKLVLVDESAWDDLERDQPELDGRVDDVVKASQAASAGGEALWARKLDTGRQAYDAAVHDRDAARLGAAVKTLKDVTDKALSRLNTRLVAVAQVLDLPALVGSLTVVREGLAALALEGKAAQRREDVDRGADALARLSEVWTTLLHNHDVLQNLQDFLGTLDPSDLVEAAAFADDWQDIRRSLDDLRGPGEAEDLPKLQSLAQAIDGLVTTDGDPANLRRTFNGFQNQLNRTFNKADSRLLDLCEDLQKFDGPLARVRQVVGHE